ncbi:MAG: alpha/beta hydrolase, partial [Terrimesophilobacter sp.]
MLLELTALAFSVALTGGSGAVGAQQMSVELPSHVRQIDIAPITVPAAGYTGSSQLTPVDISLLPKLNGQALLDQFALLPPASLSQFVKDHPETVSSLLSAPPAAHEVAGWWTSISPKVRSTFVTQTPQLIGNLDGVPYATRDLANRDYLSGAISSLRSQLASGVGRGMNVEVTNHLHMLTEIRQSLNSRPGDPSRTLVTLDTSGSGRAAIVVGNLESADYVSFLIPGMFFTIDGQVDYWANTATTLFHDQSSWLKRLGDQSRTVATVAWIGYQTPHLLNVGSLALADAGATYLTNALEGLNTLRDNNEPYVSVMAHSYGSTAAMIALQQGAVQIDALAVVGSPGSEAQSVSALSVRGGNVYVGEAGWDPVVNSAFFGSDPGAPAYGAYRMGVSGGVDAITDTRLSASYGHNEYFSAGSESMRNMALIGIGEGQMVMNDSGVTIA